MIMDHEAFIEAVRTMRELQRSNGAPKTVKTAEAKVDKMLEPKRTKVDPRQLDMWPVAK